MVGVLDTRALCRLTFIVVGTIAITIPVNVSTSFIAIVVRAASGVT